VMAHATFGLLNSTAHSVKPGSTKTAEAGLRTVLRTMTSPR
ncbi:TetR/AcrR family transcriptional regulator, partial [Mycobacterium rufum]|nr:TetR/AcrR family transcriptional regulator [Mycolicibacterium rufum]